MIVKTFEIRDAGTFIPAMAIKLGGDSEAGRYLLARAGFGLTVERQSEYVMLMRLSDQEIHYDSGQWSRATRTMWFAHQVIEKKFDELADGAVIDVEFEAGITNAPKRSERDMYDA